MEKIRINLDSIFEDASKKLSEKASEIGLPVRNLAYVWIRNNVPQNHKTTVDLAFLDYLDITAEGMALKIRSNNKSLEVLCSKFKRKSCDKNDDCFINVLNPFTRLRMLYYIGDNRALDVLGVSYFKCEINCPFGKKCETNTKEIYGIDMDTLRNRLESFATCGHKFKYFELEEITNSVMEKEDQHIKIIPS